VVSVGVNVAVIVDVPAPTTVAVADDSVATDALAEEYAHVPATELVTVGVVKLNGASPYVFDSLAHVNSGRILSTETFMVAEMLLYLPVSVGVNEPVTVAVPKLPNVMVDDASETTVVLLDT
jgi:hypothetical protein